MKDYLFKYLENDLLPRISAYKSPTEPQKTIILLCEKMAVNGSLDDEDMMLLELHTKAEKQAEKLHKARQKALSIEKKKKDDERKHKTRMKIIIGGLIEKHIKNEPYLARMLSKMVLSMDSSTKDKELLISHLRAFNVNFDVTSGDDVTGDDVTDGVVTSGDDDDVADGYIRNDNGEILADVNVNEINDIYSVEMLDKLDDLEPNNERASLVPKLPKFSNSNF